MAVAAPAGGVQINLDIAAARRPACESQNRASKIGASFVIPETGMKNDQFLAVQGPQLIAPQALMLPDALQQSFGWRGFFRLPQRGRGLSQRSPSSIQMER